MGILNFAARKGVARKAREGLQWQYYEARGEIGDPQLFRDALLSPAPVGYVFGYIGKMIQLTRIGRRHAGKALAEALCEVFGEGDGRAIHRCIGEHGSSYSTKSWFDLEAGEGEVDAEEFVVTGDKGWGLKSRLLAYVDELSK